MLRITGGEWCGRKIATPEGDATRPSMDQHRQRLMNILGHDMTGTTVLDLFAGSGAFAFECLSRGASSAVAVEIGRDALCVLRKNVAKLVSKPEMCKVIAGDCFDLKAAGVRGTFDIIFIAPPYPHFATERAGIDSIIAALPSLLNADGIAIVQHDAGQFTVVDVPGVAVDDVRAMGRTEFTFLRRATVA